jgi:hypothetical protein
MKKKYVNINIPDGLGMQLCVFNTFARSTDEYDFIVDLRNWCYFAKTKQIDFSRIFNLFDFHERAIVMPIKINEIDKKYITDIKSTKNKYIEYELTLGIELNGEKLHASYQSENLLMRLKEEPIVDFDIEQCVGVHGRFGNGEGNPALTKRVVPENLFIEKMKEYDNKFFFVCSDSKPFINLCKAEFRDRIKVKDRVFLPKGFGPGHRLSLYKDENIKVDPITLLYESYVDMHLLSKCSHLICNESMFNKPARFKIPNKNIHLLT